MAWGKKINMGTYNPTKLEAKAYAWCIRNKIYIAPKAISETRWSIVITNNGKIYEDPSHYIKSLIWDKGNKIMGRYFISIYYSVRCIIFFFYMAVYNNIFTN